MAWGRWEGLSCLPCDVPSQSSTWSPGLVCSPHSQWGSGSQASLCDPGGLLSALNTPSPSALLLDSPQVLELSPPAV